MSPPQLLITIILILIICATNRDKNDKNDKNDKKNTETHYPSDFVLFWNSYPKKTGKEAALKAWNKMKFRGDIGHILFAVKQQTASDQWKKDDGQFIPNPATWLNQGRWDDQPTQIDQKQERRIPNKVYSDEPAFGSGKGSNESVSAYNERRLREEMELLNSREANNGFKQIGHD